MKCFVGLLMVLILNGCATIGCNENESAAHRVLYQSDIEKSYSILAEQAEKGFSWAQLRLGMHYQLGIEVDKNILIAIDWYQKAADHKLTNYLEDTNSKQTTCEQRYFNQNDDVINAMFLLANIFLEGDGVDKDAAKAFELISIVKAAAKGREIFYCCKHFRRITPVSNEEINQIFEIAKQAMSEN